MSCLICSSEITEDFNWSVSESLLNEQLNTIFILRRILWVPNELLEDFLKNGEHPSEWGIMSLCGSCGEEINKCKGLLEEMMKLQRSFNERREGIIEKVKRRRADPKGISKLAKREKLVNFVVKNEYAKLTNPFVKGDLKAAELQAIVKVEDLFIGEEVAMEEIGGDFEVVEVDWIISSDLEKEIEDDSDYKPEKPSPPLPKKIKKRGRPKQKEPKEVTDCTTKLKRRRGRPKRMEVTEPYTTNSTSKRRGYRPQLRKPGLVPPPPPQNPDPLTLIPCPNCGLTKFQKNRGDILYNHLVQCIEVDKMDEIFSWNCSLCKNEVISSSSTKSSEHCLRFVEHLHSCQAPDSQKSEDNAEYGPYPLSSRLFHCDLCYPDPLKIGPSFTFPHFIDHCIFHKKFIYQCAHPTCPPTCRYPSLSSLRLHWRAYHHSSTPFSHRISTSLPTLQFYCSHCHLHFPSSHLLSQHLTSSHPNIPTLLTTSPHTCQYCSEALPSATLLSLHQIASHLEEKYFLKCPLCLTYHPTISSLASHEKSRLHLKSLQDHPLPDPQGSLICETCGTNFEDSSSLRTHLKIYHPSKKIRPFGTGPKPPTKTTDSKGRSLQCPQCNKIFNQITNLNLHVRTIHEGNWPFYCHSCGKGVATKTVLKKHLAAVHGEGDYGVFKCQFEGCGKKYFHSEVFQNHVNRHKGERMFGCEYCGKAFFGVKQLRKHLPIHTNPDFKPFQCKICPLKFRESGHLKMHMNLHKKKGDC